MIDLHCHLLPGIDDGPDSLDDSLAMCRAAANNGIQRAVVTPHILPGRYNNTLESIARAHAALTDALARQAISLQLGFAAEVRLDPAIMDMVRGGRMPYLGTYQGRKVMLLEFPHTHIPPGSDTLVQWLLDAGVTPMIAHPERNGDVIRKPGRIKPFVEAGCLLQVTAGALTGGFGAEAKRRGKYLLRKGWVTILASDAHDLEWRTPEMELGRQAAAGIIGEDEAWALVRDRPAQIAAMHFC